MSEKTGERAHPRTLIGQEVTSLDVPTQNERDDREVSELMVAHVHQRKRYVKKRLKKREKLPPTTGVLGRPAMSRWLQQPGISRISISTPLLMKTNGTQQTFNRGGLSSISCMHEGARLKGS